MTFSPEDAQSFMQAMETMFTAGLVLGVVVCAVGSFLGRLVHEWLRGD